MSNSFTAEFISEVEQAILLSNIPLSFNGSQSLSINGQSGILLNANEINNWKGEIPLKEYSINEDDNPKVIYKKSQKIIDTKK